MAIHVEPFKDAGKTLKLNAPGIDGEQIHIEDYWDRVFGKSWQVSDWNPAAMQYGIRSGVNGLPLDNEVVYGKVDGLGHLVHVSELGEVTS